MVNRDSRPRVVLAGRRRQARAGTLADRASPGPSDRLPTSSVGSRSRRSHHRGEGCFGHQLLLGGQTHSPNMEAHRLGRLAEREHDIPQYHEKQPR
jgi:hypothetical protein